MKKILLIAILLMPIIAEAQVTRVWIRQGTTLPASCTNKTVLFHLTVADGSSPAGIYRCNGSTFVATGGGVTSPVLAGNGTAAAPTYSFSSDPNTGMFRSAADSIGFSTAGVEKWLINSSGALNPLISNTYDIGGSTTIRDIGIGRQAVFSGSTSGTTNLKATATAGTTTLTLPAVTDTLVALDATQTLTNKTLTSPRIGTDISDTNGNELFKFTATGSAVNELTVTNAAASGEPQISATGSDTDVDIKLTPKGAGTVNVTTAGGIKFSNGSIQTVAASAGTTILSAYKAGDENVTGSDTLQNDDHLTVTVTSGHKYDFKIRLHVASGGDGGIKVAVGGTATQSTIIGTIWGVNVEDAMTTGVSRFASAESPNGYYGNHFITIDGSVVFSSGGTFVLRWAQDASDVDTATVMAGSTMILTDLN